MKKYYIFSHINGEKIRYNMGDSDAEDGWSEYTDQAVLFNSEDAAIYWGDNLEPPYEDGRRYVVGCFNVETDPLYAMKVIK